MSDMPDFCFDNDLNYEDVSTFVQAVNENAFVVRVDNDKRVTTRNAKIVSWGVRKTGETVPVFAHPILPNETFCIVERSSVYCYAVKMEMESTTAFLNGVRKMLADWDSYIEPEVDEDADDSEAD
ncbi:hypothetical protein [Flavobacterium sp.]|jgi:hypothetical protein|uniref:hypothetical protein n=1 Tax=Flavobacterium sp. TaxID=239 RepID=UPI0037BEBC17